jgi:GNAT superfamily N-acetyltransferase
MAFYAGLSPTSRRLRFFAATRGISEAQSTRFCAPDHHHREGFVAECAGSPSGEPRVVGHLCLEPAADGSAEVAIAVADEFQRRGIGRRLLTAGLEWARNEGVARLSATMLEANFPIYRLLASCGLPYHCQRHGASEIEMTIELGAERIAA